MKRISLNLQILIGCLVGLAAVIAWSGGFFAKKVKPGKLENQAGVAVPAEAATIEAKVRAFCAANPKMKAIDAEMTMTGL